MSVARPTVVDVSAGVQIQLPYASQTPQTTIIIFRPLTVDSAASSHSALTSVPGQDRAWLVWFIRYSGVGVRKWVRHNYSVSLRVGGL